MSIASPNPSGWIVTAAGAAVVGAADVAGATDEVGAASVEETSTDDDVGATDDPLEHPTPIIVATTRAIDH